MKLGFVTCVQLGLSCMKAIYEKGSHLDLVITLQDNNAIYKSGRVYLDKFCEDHSIPLVKTFNINDSKVIKKIKDLEIDWLFIIGWSQIASQDVLKAPIYGVLGMHPTLLPEGRGRAAIPWTILKGLKKTGVTLFKMDSGVDTGPIAEQVEIALHDEITATELYHMVEKEHTQLISQTLQLILDNTIEFKKQDTQKKSIWPGRKPEDGEIQLEGSVHDAYKLIRAVTHPYPGAFYYNLGIKTIVWSAKLLLNKQPKKKDKYIKFYDGILLIKDFSEVIKK